MKEVYADIEASLSWDGWCMVYVFITSSSSYGAVCISLFLVRESWVVPVSQCTVTVEVAYWSFLKLRWLVYGVCIYHELLQLQSCLYCCNQSVSSKGIVSGPSFPMHFHCRGCINIVTPMLKEAHTGKAAIQSLSHLLVQAGRYTEAQKPAHLAFFLELG